MTSEAWLLSHQPCLSQWFNKPSSAASSSVRAFVRGFVIANEVKQDGGRAVLTALPNTQIYQRGSERRFRPPPKPPLLVWGRASLTLRPRPSS